MRFSWTHWLHRLVRNGQQRRGARPSVRRRLHLTLETLEDRTVPSTFTVTTLAGDNVTQGSLGYEITQANRSGGTIDFQQGLTGTIKLTSVLPDLTGNVIIQDPQAALLTVDASGVRDGFIVDAGANVFLTGLTITGASAAIIDFGSLAVTACVISGNVDGIDVYTGLIQSTASPVTLAASTIANNSGYGLWAGPGSTANHLTLTSCTVSQNSGGIDDQGGHDILTVSNSTICGNTINGGIVAKGTATLSCCTIVNNTSESINAEAGGIQDSNQIVIYNSLVAQNEAPRPLNQSPVPSDVLGNIDSLGYNLIGASGSGGWLATDLLNVNNPMLGNLQNNGGPTATVALLPGSPAIDAGDPTYTGDALDQRGFNRVVNNRIDIGAYESQPPQTQVALLASATTRPEGQPITFTAVINAVPGSNDRTGTVTFLVNGVAAGSSAVSNDEAVFTTETLTPGQNQIVAQYNGDTEFSKSESSSQVITVTPTSTTSLTTSAVQSILGQSVTFTASVSANSAGFGVPTGSVTFTVDGASVAVVPLTANAGTTFSTSSLIAGQDTITAIYSGDNLFPSSSASLVEPVAFAAMLSVAGGNGQTMPVGSTFGTLLQVKVTDDFGNPLAGVPVTFGAPGTGTSGTGAVGSGVLGIGASGTGALGTGMLGIGAPGTGASGTFVAVSTVLSNAMGIATAPAFVANNTQGTYTVTAFVSGTLSVPFTLTNVAAPAAVEIVGGNHQHATVNVASTTPLQVKVVDAFGNPIGGINVVFSVPETGAGGSLATATAVTNDTGVATASLTANTLAGNFIVLARVAGVNNPARFRLSNQPAAPTVFQPTAGTPQSAAVGSSFTQALQMMVTDAYGNPVPHVPVRFTSLTKGAGGQFGGKASVVVRTDSNGLATAPALTANKHAGNFVVATSVKGVSTPVTFSLTNLPGPPAALLVVAGTPQTQGAFDVYPVPLEVKVTDAYGNPVSGVTVTFQAPATGPSGTFIIAGGNSAVTVEAQTDADGLATAPSFTANTEMGSLVVIASISTGLEKAFHLTNSDT